MYEEDKYSINWFKVGVRLVIILLIILLSIKLVSILIADKTNVKEKGVMNKQLTVMDKIANDYFKDDKLPINVGESIEVSLEDLIKLNLIKEIKNENGEKCDNKKSYIRATRLDSKYQIKSNLVCKDYSDYKNSFKEINEEQVIKVTTTVPTTTTTKNIETTRKIKTTKSRSYTVSFNTNGGNQLDSQTVKENEIITNIVPIRDGYSFVGWYYHGVRFDVNTKINQNYVLTAKWVIE